MTSDGNLYTATVTDFTARDPAIYRMMGAAKYLRTAQYNSRWLNGRRNCWQKFRLKITMLLSSYASGCYMTQANRQQPRLQCIILKLKTCCPETVQSILLTSSMKMMFIFFLSAIISVFAANRPSSFSCKIHSAGPIARKSWRVSQRSLLRPWSGSQSSIFNLLLASFVSRAWYTHREGVAKADAIPLW